MSKAKDWTGQTFNMLTFVRYLHNDKHGNRVWELQCECGETTECYPSEVSSGKVQSCGCLKHRTRDYTGVQSGKLTLLRPTTQRTNTDTILWVASCQCGNDNFLVRPDQVAMGNVLTCGCSRIEDHTGEKYNYLTFLRCTGRGKNGHVMWEVRCDCGQTLIRTASEVVKGKAKSCGCMNENVRDYTGEKHGRLTFMRPTEERGRNSGVIWEVLCECGIITQILAHQVVSGHTTSCGCARQDYLDDLRQHGNPHTRKFDPMVSSARAIWGASYTDGDIDFDTFLTLSQQLCDYCGDPPKNCFNVGGSKAGSEYQRQQGAFIYNGLDRVDSTRGHTLDNVVPCCLPCNWAKGKRSRAEFLAHNERIYLHATRPKPNSV